MTIIKVNEFLETAFDMEDAEILKEKNNALYRI